MREYTCNEASEHGACAAAGEQHMQIGLMRAIGAIVGLFFLFVSFGAIRFGSFDIIRGSIAFGGQF